MTHILIVEDNDQQRNEIAAALTGAGHIVDAAVGGNLITPFYRIVRKPYRLEDVVAQATELLRGSR